MVVAMKRLVVLIAVVLGVVALTAPVSSADRTAPSGSPPPTVNGRALHQGHHHKCDPNYAGACLRPNVSDYDCRGGSGNGPYYTGEVRVVGVDHYGLDADGDGIGCEED